MNTTGTSTVPRAIRALGYFAAIAGGYVLLRRWTRRDAPRFGEVPGVYEDPEHVFAAAEARRAVERRRIAQHRRAL